MVDKTDRVSIRKYVGQYENQTHLLYYVLVNGHTTYSFLTSERAEAYVVKYYGHVPLVRRDY